MVVLETAAIGAAGYGLWRGGEAATNKTKEALKEHKRERHRRDQRKELTQKAKERKEKLSQLAVMRTPGGAPPAVATTASLVSSSSAATRMTSPSASSSVLDRMRADHGKASSGGRFKTLFKKK